MKHDDFIDRLGKVFLECIDLAKNKNHDYAHVEDALENFRDFGVMGIVVRLGDKYHRLKNVLQKGGCKVQDESVKDTLRDTLIYSAIALVLEEEKSNG